jgi:hypothetical protein
MAKHHLEARYDGHKHRVEISLDVITWEESGVHFHYAPALDITGYGQNANDASASFKYQLDEFVVYTLNKGTVYDELERLGWTVNKKKKRVVAPDDAEMLADNETYRNLVNMQGVNKFSTNLELAL